MARLLRTAALTFCFIGLAAPAVSAGGLGGGSEPIGPERACLAGDVCATAHHPAVCWHGDREDGAVCFSFMP